MNRVVPLVCTYVWCDPGHLFFLGNESAFAVMHIFPINREDWPTAFIRMGLFLCSTFVHRSVAVMSPFASGDLLWPNFGPNEEMIFETGGEMCF